jgi:hypothetical protein
MLPDEAVKEFKEIYKEEFGHELSNEKVKRKAENLIGLFKAVYDSSKRVS